LQSLGGEERSLCYKQEETNSRNNYGINSYTEAEESNVTWYKSTTIKSEQHYKLASKCRSELLSQNSTSHEKHIIATTDGDALLLAHITGDTPPFFFLI